MFEDDYRYEEEDYESDDYKYIEDDEEEDENALWDDTEDISAHDDMGEPPEKKQRTRKKKADFSNDNTYADEAEMAEQEKRQIALEQNIIDRLDADAEEHPFEDDAGDEEPERKKLKRELRAEALARLEDAARTQRDFENVIAWWDRLDADRERRERYHELSRSGDDVPLDYGASANELFFLIC